MAMDAWVSASQRNGFNVYLGLWTNWSQGRILGSTLTLTKSNGALVIAFAAFFITIVATRFWRMACVVAHQVYCRSVPEPRDVLYHHRQAILRNSPTAISGLRSFILVLLAHRKSTRQLFIRIFPILLFSLFSIAGFTVLTYFLPQITTSMSDQVLLVGDHCGQIFEGSAESQDYKKYLSTLNIYIRTEMSDAESYAQQCYSESSQTLQCSAFVTDRIPSTVNTTAGCPFHPGVCRLDGSNIRLDTGLIDLNRYTGINIPVNEGMSVRRSLHCAPLQTDGYTSSYQVENRNFTRYHYGSYRNADPGQPYPNATAQFINVEGQYPQATDYEQYEIPARNYELQTLTSLAVNGTVTKGSDFYPIPELHRDDADLMLVFLLGGGVYFIEPSQDPWYRATSLADNTTVDYLNNSAPSYRMDDAASPLGCAIQWQFCQAGPSETPICGNLASFNDATSSFLVNAAHVNKKLLWYLDIIYNAPGVWDVLAQLQARALVSQRTLNSGFQGPIPGDQWHLDVAHWWATALAAGQASFINTVTGPPDSFQIPHDWIRGPMDNDEQYACNNQKVRSAAHSSFNMFGLALFFVVGSLIVVTSFALEPLLAALHKRWGYQENAYLEWVTQETLQLQRLAHEELGFGTWSGATNAVPTTKLDEKLAGLDLRDSKHPRLRISKSAPEENTDTTDSGEPTGEAVSLSTQEMDISSLSNRPDSGRRVEHNAASDNATEVLATVTSAEPAIPEAGSPSRI